MSDSPSSSDASSDLYAEVDAPASHPVALPSDSTRHTPISEDSSSDSSPEPTPKPAKGKRRRKNGQESRQKSSKKRKVVFSPEPYFSAAVPSVARLPAEIWQHIFLYLTPDDLSRCLRVNTLFRAYLTELTASMSIRLPPRRNGLKLLDSESIWTSARKLFAINLPRPLAGFTEVHMFQLLGGRACQACGFEPAQPIQPTTPFDAGPGRDGVRIIWSFAARLCGSCFELYSVKVGGATSLADTV